MVIAQWIYARKDIEAGLGGKMQGVQPVNRAAQLEGGRLGSRSLVWECTDICACMSIFGTWTGTDGLVVICKRSCNLAVIYPQWLQDTANKGVNPFRTVCNTNLSRRFLVAVFSITSMLMLPNYKLQITIRI